MRQAAYIELDSTEVACRAIRLWNAAGRPGGCDSHFWLKAEVELLAAKTAMPPRPASSLADLPFGHDGHSDD